MRSFSGCIGFERVFVGFIEFLLGLIRYWF